MPHFFVLSCVCNHVKSQVNIKIIQQGLFLFCELALKYGMCSIDVMPRASNAYLYRNGMLLVGTLLEQKFGCAST